MESEHIGKIKEFESICEGILSVSESSPFVTLYELVGRIKRIQGDYIWQPLKNIIMLEDISIVGASCIMTLCGSGKLFHIAHEELAVYYMQQGYKSNFPLCMGDPRQYERLNTEFWMPSILVSPESVISVIEDLGLLEAEEY